MIADAISEAAAEGFDPGVLLDPSNPSTTPPQPRERMKLPAPSLRGRPLKEDPPHPGVLLKECHLASALERLRERTAAAIGAPKVCYLALYWD